MGQRPPKRGGDTSLVSNRVSLQAEDAGGERDCGGFNGYFLRSDATGQFVPLACQRNRCLTCGPRKAVATGIAAGSTGVNQFITLTLVGDDHRTVRARLSRLRYDLAKRGYPGEWYGAIERNPRGTGSHVHLWRRGSWLPQVVLADRADAWGMGRIADIRAWSGGPRGVIYGVKVARQGSVTYGLKTGLDGGLAAFLEVNGGRFGVWSRGMFGKPYREAVSEAMRSADREGHDPGPWRVKSWAEWSAVHLEVPRLSLDEYAEKVLARYQGRG